MISPSAWAGGNGGDPYRPGVPEAASSAGVRGRLHAWPEKARLFRPSEASGARMSAYVVVSGLMAQERRRACPERVGQSS